MSSWIRAVQLVAVTLVMHASAGELRAQEAPDSAPETDPEAGPAPEPDPSAEETADVHAVPAGLLEARAAISEARFDPALLALESALREGKAQPEHLQEIYRLQGETLVAVGKAQEAKEAFKILLVLNPAASLGEFVSPKIVSVLDQARGEIAGGTLQSRHQLDPKSRLLEVFVDSDPLAMTAKVRLVYPRKDGSAARLSIPLEAGKAVFDVPGQASTGIELALLDRHGNVILAWQVEELPMVAITVVPTEKGYSSVVSPGTGKQAIWARWWVWAGAGAVFATVGTVFGIASSSAQSDLDAVIDNPVDHFFSDAKQLEDKAKSRATWANVSFAMAGAFGIASGVMYWRARNQESSLQVVPATAGTGASLVIGGHF